MIVIKILKKNHNKSVFVLGLDSWWYRFLCFFILVDLTLCFKPFLQHDTHINIQSPPVFHLGIVISADLGEMPSLFSILTVKDVSWDFGSFHGNKTDSIIESALIAADIELMSFPDWILKLGESELKIRPASVLSWLPEALLTGETWRWYPVTFPPHEMAGGFCENIKDKVWPLQHINHKLVIMCGSIILINKDLKINIYFL